MMKKLAHALLNLNNRLYNWTFHVPVLLAWVSILLFSSWHWPKVWLTSGLAVYVFLFAFRVVMNFLDKKPLIEKDPYQSWLSYLVGLNLCVVLAILTAPVLLILSLSHKREVEAGLDDAKEGNFASQDEVDKLLDRKNKKQDK